MKGIEKVRLDIFQEIPQVFIIEIIFMLELDQDIHSVYMKELFRE
jgi:hypothetical protein